MEIIIRLYIAIVMDIIARVTILMVATKACVRIIFLLTIVY